MGSLSFCYFLLLFAICFDFLLFLAMFGIFFLLLFATPPWMLCKILLFEAISLKTYEATCCLLVRFLDFGEVVR